MTDNLALWNAVDDIDPAFTKKITGRPYQGTSPNPQYLIKLATEHLGPVGKGFGWEVLAEGFEPLGDTVLHWCRIRFWWGENHAVEQYGQTKAMYQSRNGLVVDEDAPKKSLTDAVVKALSHLGFAANIFLGRWDDQKYVATVAADFRQQAEDRNSDLAHEPAPKVPEHDIPTQTRTLIAGAVTPDGLECAREPIRKLWDGKVPKWVGDLFTQRMTYLNQSRAKEMEDFQ